MVDRISSQQSASELQSSQLHGNQQVERTNQESSNAKNADIVHLFLDQAEISDDAQARLDSERELMKLSQQAVRIDEEYNADKVGHFKSLLDSGRINDYLRGVNNQDLADLILNSPAGSILR